MHESCALCLLQELAPFKKVPRNPHLAGYITSRTSVSVYSNSNLNMNKLKIASGDAHPKGFAFRAHLHQDETDQINKQQDCKRDAERGNIRLISQLSINDEEAKGINPSIEEAISKATLNTLELQSFGRAACNCTATDGESFNYMETLRELDHVKQQICCLKLDMATALQEKAKAEAEIESSCSSIKSYSGHVQELRSGIEAANVEQVLTDMESIEVERDFRSIQKQREVESVRFTKSIRKLTSRIAELRKQICSAKKIQAKLLITASDAQVLRNEMKAIRWMNHSDQKIESLAMHVTAAELKAAKKEMSTLQAERFKLMDEMDDIRKEIMQIAERKEQSSKIKQGAEFSLQSLNAKLHQAICKLESAAAAENRAEAIVTTLSDAVDQLKADMEAARREEEMVKQETKSVRNEAFETKLRTQEHGERLHQVIAELKAVKVSELKALEELKETTEKTMRDRGISALWNSTITISKSEYYYLVKEANEAQLVADKKVAAAQAWKEALEAEEREKWALVPVEGSRKDSTSKSNRAPLLVFKRNVKEVRLEDGEEEIDQIKIKLAVAMPRRSLTISGVPETTRRQRRRSFTSATCSPPSKENGKVMAESFVKSIRGRRHQKKHCIFLRWIDRLPRQH